MNTNRGYKIVKCCVEELALTEFVQMVYECALYLDDCDIEINGINVHLQIISSHGLVLTLDQVEVLLEELLDLGLLILI